MLSFRKHSSLKSCETTTPSVQETLHSKPMSKQRQRRLDHSLRASGSGSFRSSHTSNRSSSFCLKLNVGLNVENLERLLTETIPVWVPQVREMAICKFRGMATKCKEVKTSSSCAILNESCDWMTTLLDASNRDCGNFAAQFPTHVLADLHTYIGLIREVQGDHLGGIHSFTTAVWLLHKDLQVRHSDCPARFSLSISTCESSSSSSSSKSLDRRRLSQEQLPVALYRLANAYGRIGALEKRQDLMAKAHALYFQEDDETLSESFSSSLKP